MSKIPKKGHLPTPAETHADHVFQIPPDLCVVSLWVLCQFEFSTKFMWVCLKIGYIPNEIAI